jgi:hypothetical protein
MPGLICNANSLSAIQTLEEIVHDYQNRQIMVCFVKLRSECKELFQRSGLVDLVGTQNFFSKISDAVQAIISSRGGSESSVRLSISNSRSPSGATALPFRRSTLHITDDEQYVAFGLA